MASEEEFKAAAERVKTLPSKPSNDQLLALYGLYKQATAGDASGKRPGPFKLKDRAKFDAWAAKQGTSREQARADYVAFVDGLF